MATQAEQTATLNEVLARLVKTIAEIKAVQASVDVLNTRIVELEAIISAGGSVTQELIDAVAAVKAKAQEVDDLIPDVPST